MAKATIYSPSGEVAEVESVDAREYVQHLGYSYEKPAETNTTEGMDHASQGGTSGDLGESAQTGEEAGAEISDGDGQDALPPGAEIEFKVDGRSHLSGETVQPAKDGGAEADGHGGGQDALPHKAGKKK